MQNEHENQEQTPVANGPVPEAPKEHKPKAKKVKHASKLAKQEQDLEIDTGKEYDTISLPENENDPHWDPKMKLPVPQGLIDGLAEFGWDRSMRLAAVTDHKGNLKIVHGRTRWRAIPRANAIRKKAGLPPIVAYVTVVDEQDDIEGVVRDMRRNVRLNRHVQDIDPMTLAESIVRALSAGIEEKQVANDHAVTVNELHGYLLLTDDDKCPPVVQELVREGKLPFSAALELARSAEKMTKADVTHAAEQIAKMASGGLRVTTDRVKKAAGSHDEKVATKKEIKQWLLNIQSDKPNGKHGEQVAMAAIIGIEVCLGTRSIPSAESALEKLAHGSNVKIDFKQYQSAVDVPDKPVKGQGK
jgi:hypothetical protein